jgi:hypothetical protein
MGVIITSIRGSSILSFLFLFFALALGAYIAFSLYCSGGMKRKSNNSDAQGDLRNLILLVESFHSDYKKYPQSIPLTTGNVLVSDGEHKASFSTKKGVYLIFKSKGDNYSAITTHLSGDRFYATSSSNHTVDHFYVIYSNKHKIYARKIGCWDFLFQSEEESLSDMNTYCPVLSEH